jgi:hypothetical protein
MLLNLLKAFEDRISVGLSIGQAVSLIFRVLLKGESCANPGTILAKWF